MEKEEVKVEIYEFKVKDYTTILYGRAYHDVDHGVVEDGFYIQRGDGTKYKYPSYRVEYSKKL